MLNSQDNDFLAAGVKSQTVISGYSYAVKSATQFYNLHKCQVLKVNDIM
jgi:hypothetical protein